MEAIKEILKKAERSEADKRRALRIIKNKIDTARIAEDEQDFKRWIRAWTRLLYGEILPNKCDLCGAIYETDGEIVKGIHHAVYTFPIESKDISRLCRACNNMIGEKPVRW